MSRSKLIRLATLLVVTAGFLVARPRPIQAAPGACAEPSAVTTGGTWDKRTSAPLYRSETSAATLDSKIYVAGGLAGQTSFFTEITRSFEAYDTAADSWQELAPLPQALHHVALASANGHIYLIGGYTALDFVANMNKAWAYDPKANSWSPIADLPAPRAAHTMTTLGDKIYLVGGVTAASTALWIYEPTTDRWDAHHKPMPTAREHLISVAFENKLYVIGGETPNSDGSGNETYQRVTANEVYDPAADSWTTLSPTPTARSSSTAAVLDGKIHVVGGENVQDTCVFAQHEVYDPKTDQWTTDSDLPTPRHGVVSGVVDNRWYTIAGATKPGYLTITALTNTVEVFTTTH